MRHYRIVRNTTDNCAIDSTYAPGQMLVSTNSGTLRTASGGFEGPNVSVMVKATSKEMYVVATKNRREKMPIGYVGNYQQVVDGPLK